IVIESILHSHVSDHADGGHFGDVLPCDIHSAEVFDRWTKALSDAMEAREAKHLHQNGTRPAFSRVLSGEFEAAKSSDGVIEFAQRLGAAAPASSPANGNGATN